MQDPNKAPRTDSDEDADDRGQYFVYRDSQGRTGSGYLKDGVAKGAYDVDENGCVTDEERGRR